MTFDPFEAFDLPHEYDIDPDDVEHRYLIAAAKAHPDRFNNLEERQQAEQRSAMLNRARTTLLNDEERAESLIAILGGHTRSDNKTLPDGFLVEILETREEIENAISSGDPNDRTRIEQWAEVQRQEYKQRVTDLFAQQQRNPDGNALRQIRIELNAWRYIERLIEQLKESI